MKKGDLVLAVKGTTKGSMGVIVDIQVEDGLRVDKKGKRPIARVIQENWVTVCWEGTDAVTCKRQDYFELISHARQA
jgi:hypothetical protein